jgi:hypothetical protein
LQILANPCKSLQIIDATNISNVTLQTLANPCKSLQILVNHCKSLIQLTSRSQIIIANH